MSREIREDIAFVLHRHAWKESSFILRILTRSHGRISVIARGMRGSKTQSPLIPGQPCQLQWKPGRDLGTLVSLSLLPPQRNAPLGDNWWASQYLTEMVLHATHEAEPVPALFDQYLSCLDRLRDRAVDAAGVLRVFELELLRELGLGFDPARDCMQSELDPDARYRLVPEEGLRHDPLAGIAAADWLALARGQPDPAAARRLRQPLQQQLALLVDFSKLRSREQWRAAQVLRKEHEQDASRDQ